jgi:hypothetical protein
MLGGGSFLGTGLSFWTSRAHTFTPAWLLHGVPVTRRPIPVFIVAESRLFLDHTMTSQQLQFWGGVRVRSRR